MAYLATRGAAVVGVEIVEKAVKRTFTGDDNIPLVDQQQQSGICIVIKLLECNHGAGVFFASRPRLK